MIAAERDQVRADQAVGGEAADEERGEQEPERARARAPGPVHRRWRRSCRCAARRRRRRGGIAAVRHQSDLRGPVRHQPPGQRHQAAAAAATAQTTRVQSPEEASAARAGNTSVPVAALAVSRPITSPRWALNQRFTTVAPSTMATAPELMPENTPQLSSRCQGSVIGAGRAGHGHQAQRANEHPAQAEVFHRGGGEGTDQAIEEDPQRGGE